MTPEEKANELFNMMMFGIALVSDYENYKAAKQCALIAVDEIISSYTGNLENGTIDFVINPNPIEYWNEVEEALNKI